MRSSSGASSARRLARLHTRPASAHAPHHRSALPGGHRSPQPRPHLLRHSLSTLPLLRIPSQAQRETQLNDLLLSMGGRAAAAAAAAAGAAQGEADCAAAWPNLSPPPAERTDDAAMAAATATAAAAAAGAAGGASAPPPHPLSAWPPHAACSSPLYPPPPALRPSPQRYVPDAVSYTGARCAAAPPPRLAAAAGGAAAGGGLPGSDISRWEVEDEPPQAWLPSSMGSECAASRGG